MLKRTDQSSSHPQSQDQPPRAKKYKQREIDGMSNSGMSGINSAAGGVSVMGSEGGYKMGGNTVNQVKQQSSKALNQSPN